LTFATDEDYNFVFDKADASLRTSRLANMYDDDDEQEDGDLDDESDGSDSQNDEDNSA